MNVQWSADRGSGNRGSWGIGLLCSCRCLWGRCLEFRCVGLLTRVLAAVELNSVEGIVSPVGVAWGREWENGTRKQEWISLREGGGGGGGGRTRSHVVCKFSMILVM